MPSSGSNAKTLAESAEAARVAIEIFRRLNPEWAAQCWAGNAHDHQREPKGDWTTWLLLGGRGAGKTRAGAEWIRALAGGRANDNAKRKSIALVAESYADAREVMIEGPSGICAVAAPGERPVYESSRRRLVWPDGAVAYAFSAEDPDGIRGYQFDAAWSDAFSDPWPGGAALYRSAGEGAPVLTGFAPSRAVMGRLKSALAPAGSGRRIYAPLDVRLHFGALSSREDEDFFAGAGAFAVKSDDGGWELIQFQNAELQENGDWRLTGLLRGQAGTERQALAGASVEARFVLLNGAVTQIEFAASSRIIAFDWQAGPDGVLPGTESFTSDSLTMRARGLMPLSPVHLRARRAGDDIHVSWIRRTRQGGDSWAGEVPLGEQAERYRLTVYDGETPVRTVETAAPACLYASADITADFGGPIAGGAVTFAVAQISDAVGEGVEARGDVAIA